MRSRRALAVIVLLLVVVGGGVVVGLTGAPNALRAGSMLNAPSTQNIEAGPALASIGTSFGFGAVASSTSAAANVPISAGAVTTLTTTEIASSTVSAPASGSTIAIQGNSQAFSTGAPLTAASAEANSSRDIEFFTNVTLQAPSASAAFTKATAIAYSLGGYVSDSTESNTTALVVIRVPAASDQEALAQVEGLGTRVTLSSSSNDVTVQYTDLNATLQSLQAEQSSLLTILGQSTNINSTLNVESRVQSVDQQINAVESEILQTRTLVSYATISTFIEEKAPAQPLTIKVTATPRTGDAPLSVTFNAVTKGGVQPYIVNYNFGDGHLLRGAGAHTHVPAGRALQRDGHRNGRLGQRHGGMDGGQRLPRSGSLGLRRLP